jgi:hypothetical protein
VCVCVCVCVFHHYVQHSTAFQACMIRCQLKMGLCHIITTTTMCAWARNTSVMSTDIGLFDWVWVHGCLTHTSECSLLYSIPYCTHHILCGVRSGALPRSLPDQGVNACQEFWRDRPPPSSLTISLPDSWRAFTPATLTMRTNRTRCCSTSSILVACVVMHIAQ